MPLSVARRYSATPKTWGSSAERASPTRSPRRAGLRLRGHGAPGDTGARSRSRARRQRSRPARSGCCRGAAGCRQRRQARTSAAGSRRKRPYARRSARAVSTGPRLAPGMSADTARTFAPSVSVGLMSETTCLVAVEAGRDLHRLGRRDAGRHRHFASGRRAQRRRSARRPRPHSGGRAPCSASACRSSSSVTSAYMPG